MNIPLYDASHRMNQAQRRLTQVILFIVVLILSALG